MVEVKSKEGKEFTVAYFEGDQERKAWFAIYQDGVVKHQCMDNRSLIDALFKLLGATLEYREVDPEWYVSKTFGALPKTLKECMFK